MTAIKAKMTKISVSYPDDIMEKTKGFIFQPQIDLNNCLTSVSETWIKQKKKYPVSLLIERI